MAVMEFTANGKVKHNSKRVAETLSVVELFRMFPNEEACYAWLEAARWGDTPVCPHCGGIENMSRPKSKPHTYWHKDCRKQFTVTTGTCMHATKRPLQDWIYTIYSVLTARKGISAMQLSKELGVQYRTAWHMLHRVREACAPGTFTLSNIVEVDETYVGGKEKNRHLSKQLKAGRGPVGKTPVIGARQRDGKVAARAAKRVDKETMVGFIEEHAEQGSSIYTDDAAAYGGLVTMFNRQHHETVNHSSGEYVCGEAHTNSIEAVWAVLKRSTTGTWHHVSVKHLDRYVNEALFPLNEGNCQVDTIERMEALASQVGGRRLRYKDLVA